MALTPTRALALSPRCEAQVAQGGTASPRLSLVVAVVAISYWP